MKNALCLLKVLFLLSKRWSIFFWRICNLYKNIFQLFVFKYIWQRYYNSCKYLFSHFSVNLARMLFPVSLWTKSPKISRNPLQVCGIFYVLLNFNCKLEVKRTIFAFIMYQEKTIYIFLSKFVCKIWWHSIVWKFLQQNYFASETVKCRNLYKSNLLHLLKIYLYFKYICLMYKENAAIKVNKTAETRKTYKA